MYKKILIFALVLMFSFGFMQTNTVKAEETKYEDINDYLRQMARNFPQFDIKENAVYLFLNIEHDLTNGMSSGYYILEILDAYNDIDFYLSGDIWFSKSKTYRFYYIGYSFKTDYTDFVYTVKYENTSTGLGINRYGDSQAVYYYSDKYIYDSSQYGSVAFYCNKNKSVDIPYIPSIIKEMCESYIIAKASPMKKKYSDEVFLLVSNAPEFILRWGDRALTAIDDGLYTGDVEIYRIIDGEWISWKSSVTGWFSNDKENYGVEYAPQILYTNKPVYHQDSSSTSPIASSELYCDIKMDNIFTGENNDDIETEPEEPVELPPVDKTLKLQEITKTGFKYNGVEYKWSAMSAVIDINNLEDYIVFYDDLEKKLYFVWTNDDSLMAQANYKMMNSSNVSFHFDIYTKKTNSSATDFYWCEYKINSNGYLNELVGLRNGLAENDTLRLDLGWTNPDYTIQDETSEGDAKIILPEYQNFVLQNNIVVSTCDIFNYSGVQIYSKTNGIINDNIKPDEIPDDLFGALKYYLYEKLPIIQTVEVFIYKFKNVLQTMKDTDKAPEIIMKIDNFYGYSGEINVLDISWYEPYRDYVKAIISALLIVPFVIWIYRKGIPDAIGGI